MQKSKVSSKGGSAFGGKMIVAQQKFLSEIFAEHHKFCILNFAF
jgi:hypothetical protein